MTFVIEEVFTLTSSVLLVVSISYLVFLASFSHFFMMIYMAFWIQNCSSSILVLKRLSIFVDGETLYTCF